jgi:hypothetical protein
MWVMWELTRDDQLRVRAFTRVRPKIFLGSDVNQPWYFMQASPRSSCPGTSHVPRATIAVWGLLLSYDTCR